MADFASQISQARQAGYSDQEITAYLGKDPTLTAKIGQAKAAGYADNEIVDHLASAPAQPAKAPGIADQIGGAFAGAWDKLKSDVASDYKQSTDGRLPSSPLDALRSEGRKAGIVKDVGGLVAGPIGAAWNGLVAHPFGEAVSSLPMQAYSSPTLSTQGGLHITPGRALSREETAQTFQNALNTGMGAMLPGPGAGVAAARLAAPANPLATAGADALAAKVLSRSRPDVSAMRATAQQMQSAGVTPTLVDVAGDAGRRMVRAVGVKNADAGEVLANNAQTVSSSAKPAIMDRTRGVVSDPRTADQLVADVLKARDEAATSNYKTAYETPVPLDDQTMAALSDAPGRAALQRALRAAVARQDDKRVTEIQSLLKAGSPMPAEPAAAPRLAGLKSVQNQNLLNPSAAPTQYYPTPEAVSGATLDRAQIAFRNQAERLRRNQGGDIASGLTSRQADINAALDNVPELAGARADYRAKSQALDVLDKGRKDVFSTDPADYGTWLQGLSPEARKANQVAIRQEVLDTLGGQRSSTFGSVDELATSEYAKANLRQALGKAADPYLGYLSAKLSQVRNARMVDPNAGSRTAVLSNDLAGVLNGAVNAADVGVKVARGDVVGLVGKAANWLKTRGVSDAEAQALARASVDPAALPRVLRQLENRMGRPAAMRYLHVVKSVPILPAVGAAQSIQGPSGTAPALAAPAVAGQQQ